MDAGWLKSLSSKVGWKRNPARKPVFARRRDTRVLNAGLCCLATLLLCRILIAQQFGGRASCTFRQKVVAVLAENLDRECLALAMDQTEPYSRSYRNQHIDLEGPEYAYYNWQEPIQKFQIDVQKETNASDCRIVLKVKDRELYVYTENVCYDHVTKGSDVAMWVRYESAVELILLALEVYAVPDVDFVINLSDTGDLDAFEFPVPAMYYSLRMHSKMRGFTYPSFGAYQVSLGSHQVHLKDP